LVVGKSITSPDTYAEFVKIAVVVLDALRKDAFDEAFDYVRGRRFENAWSTSHWTVPAHASLFTGVYPSEHGSTAKHIELSYEGPTLAEQLRKHGISTRGISANGNLSPINKYDRGFETYVTESGQPRRDVVNWPKFINENEDEGVRRYLSALRTSVSSEYDTLQSLKYAFQIKFDTRPEPGEKLHAEGMMETISEMNFDQNSFLFMNLMDAHQLFEPPRSYQSCEYHDMDITDQLSALALQDEAPPKADDFVTGYGDSVNYLSDIFSDIYRYLVDEFDYVIMLSDHGDALGEQGVWGHIPSLQSEITRVPLVIMGVELYSGG
jgi:arylsulfatase A-like enzyme